MEGRGYYNEHSELQARSAEEADGVLGRALAAVPRDNQDENGPTIRMRICGVRGGEGRSP
jgi:hypothetical protein